MKISPKQILMVLLLLVIGYCYSMYSGKINQETEKEEKLLIQQFLANDVNNMDVKKPFLWIPIEYEINQRDWLDFGSRNTMNLNQPYLYLTIRSIIEKCGDSFNICIIDDNVFNKLLPNWSIHVGRLTSPLKPHMRELAMAKLLNKYGGMRLPPSFICFEDLITLYELGVSMETSKGGGFFVSEMVSSNILSSSITFAPCSKIMGCKKDSEVMRKYIEYLEVLISKDYTEGMDFEGKISKWLFNEISKGSVNLIKPELIGAKKLDDSPVLLEDLMSDSNIELSKESFGLYINSCELLRRRNFGWFVRMSPSQVLHSNTQVGKYLLAMN
jgi:hypothetical protein